MTCVELTGIWPALPIIIRNEVTRPIPEDFDFDTAIVHHNRVCEVDLVDLSISQLQRLAMQEQFPALIHLKLKLKNGPPLALPDGFLGGSAPHLRSLTLHSIPLPALPKLLLSATHLVYLDLRDIPRSGYFSPEAIVTGLAVMASLKSLTIEFEYPLLVPLESRHPPPPTPAVLPALTRFGFHGPSEYLEKLVARIDAPLLDSIRIAFFYPLTIDTGMPQLAQFIRRMIWPEALNEAHVVFDYSDVEFESLPPTRTFEERSGLRVSCTQLDWQRSPLAQVFTSLFPSVYMVEHFYIYGSPIEQSSIWGGAVNDIQWLEIFHPFTAMKNLYISKKCAPRIAPLLQELAGDRVTEVLPTLQNIFVEELQSSGPIPEAFGKFVAARCLFDHPIAVSLWEKDPERDWSRRTAD
jgi:hypothetical protein